MNYLADNFSKAFDKQKTFEECVQKMSDCTHYVVKKGIDVTLLTACPWPIENRPKNTQLFLMLTRQTLVNFETCGAHMTSGYVVNNKIGSLQMIDELKASSQMMAIIDDEKYVMSPHAINQLGEIIGMRGEWILNNSSMILNMAFAKALMTAQRAQRPMTFIYRENEEGVKKIFSVVKGGVPSKKDPLKTSWGYRPTKQAVLIDVLTLLKGSETVAFERGEVRTEATEMWLKVRGADIGDEVGGYVTVTTSDVGKHGFLVRQVLKHGDGDIYLDEACREHRRVITAEELAGDVKEAADGVKAMAAKLDAEAGYSYTDDEYLENAKAILKAARTTSTGGTLIGTKVAKPRAKELEAKASGGSARTGLTKLDLLKEVISFSTLATDEGSKRMAKKALGKLAASL